MTRLLSPSVAREQRRTQVAEGLLAGLSIRQIAVEIGSSKATVQRDSVHVQEQWRAEYVDDADHYIRHDLKRVDTALAAIWPDVKKGDLPAVDRMVKLLDQRAKYLGLYSPTKVQGAFNVMYLNQVRNEDAVIAEYSEIINDAAERILNPGSDSAAGVEAEALALGGRQD